jgi:hypothetical protein
VEQIHRNMMEVVRAMLQSRLKALPETAVTSLLEKTWRYALVADIQPIVLSLLALHSKLPDRFLKALYAQPQLLDLCPLSVKQQVRPARLPNSGSLGGGASSIGSRLPHRVPLNWLASRRRLPHAQVWGMYPEPFTRLAEKLLVAAAPRLSQRWLQQANLLEEGNVDVFVANADTDLQELIEMVGSRVSLYNCVLALIRQKFVAGNHAQFGALRLLFAIGLVRGGAETIALKDPCHKFSVKFNNIISTASPPTESQLRDLTAALAAVPGDSPQRGDIGMMLCHPAVTMALVRALHVRIHELIKASHLPRSDTALQACVQVRAAHETTTTTVPHPSHRWPTDDDATSAGCGWLRG